VADAPSPADGAPAPYDRQTLSRRRLTARVLDLAVAAILVALYGLQVPGGPVWLLLAVAYLALGDALTRRGSPGKRLVGLQVVQVRKKRHAGWRSSLIRNGPGAVPLLLLLIHGALGVILAAAVGGLVLALETYLTLREGDGIRIGDICADTAVIPDDVPLSEVVDSDEYEAYGTGEERRDR